MSVQTRGAVGLYLLFLALYLATASGHFFSSEEIAVYQTSQSIVEERSLEISRINDAVPRNGKWYSQYEPGQAVASIPLYVLGNTIDSFGSRSVNSYFAAADVNNLYQGTVPIFFVSTFNQLVTPLLCVLIYLFCLKLGFSLRASIATAVVFGAGTLAWSQASEYFQHPLETLFLLSAVYLLFARGDRLTPRDAFLASVLLACGVQARVSVIVAVPLVFLYLAWLRLLAFERESGADQRQPILSRINRFVTARALAEWRYVIPFAIPILITVFLSMWLAHFRTGHWLAIHGGGQGVEASTKFGPQFLPKGIVFLLFSPGRSLFLYSPPVIASLFVFRRFWKEHTDLALLFIGIFVAYLLLYSCFEYSHGGLSWGPRYLFPSLPFLIIPVAYLFEKKTTALALGALTAIGALISILAISVDPGFATRAEPVHNYDYLWTIDRSPLVLHAKEFFNTNHWDLWLRYVFNRQGAVTFAATLAFFAAIAAAGLAVLRSAWVSQPRVSD